MSLEDSSRSNLKSQAAMRWLIISLVLAAALGCLYLGYFVNNGVGIGYDSMFYLTSAENLLTGNGLTWIGGGGSLKPLVHYPPAYPIVLAGFGSIGIELITVATGYHILVFGLSGALMGAVVFTATRSHILALVATLFFFVSPAIVDLYLEAQTEPMYLILLLGLFLALGVYRHHPNLSVLLLISIIGVVGYLTRYIGSTMLGISIFWILFSSARAKRKSWNHLGILLLIAIPPSLLWIFRNFRVSGSLTNRVLGFHPLTSDQLKEGVATITAWVIPSSVDIKLRVLLFLLLLLPLGIALIKWFVSENSMSKLKHSILEGNGRVNFIFILILHIFVYSFFLLLSITFFDASTRLNSRILAPLFLSILLLLIIGAQRLSGLYKVYGVGLLVSFVLLSSYRSQELLRNFKEHGKGFNGSAWSSSETISQIRDLDQVSNLYTTEASAVYFQTKLPAHWVPEKLDPVKGEVRLEYDDQMREMTARLSEPNAYLVVFWRSLNRVELPTLSEMTSGLELYLETEDGAIYTMKQP